MAVAISRIDLAQRTREAIDQVLTGQVVMIENDGAEQATLVNAKDYHLLCAVAAYHGRPESPVNDSQASPRGLSESEVQNRAAAGGRQGVWDMVIASYLDGEISLGRAAILLGLQRFDLLVRFDRLGLPVRVGPATLREAQADYEALRDSSVL